MSVSYFSSVGFLVDTVLVFGTLQYDFFFYSPSLVTLLTSTIGISIDLHYDFDFLFTY